MPVLDLLTVDDLAALFRVSVQTIDSWIKAGKLPKPIKVGHRRLWRSADIDAELEKRRDGATAAR
jgi:excisionase family DNA binding protein